MIFLKTKLEKKHLKVSLLLVTFPLLERVLEVVTS